MILYQKFKKLLKKQENPIYISVKDSLNYEKGLGLDVAAVQKFMLLHYFITMIIVIILFLDKFNN